MNFADDFDDAVRSRADLDRNPDIRDQLERAARLRLGEDPADTDALLTVGDAMASKGFYDDARAYYLRACNSDRRCVPALMSCAGEYIRDGNFKLAEKFFRLAVEAKPKSPSIINSLAICLLNQGKRDEAVDMFNQAITTKFTYPMPYFMLAGIYAREGNFQMANERIMDAVFYADQAGELKLKNDSITMLRQIKQQLDKPASGAPEAGH